MFLSLPYSLLNATPSHKLNKRFNELTNNNLQQRQNRLEKSLFSTFVIKKTTNKKLKHNEKE
jgi:hypothetical protein